MLTRDLNQLTTHTFDLLVIGGGIHGACLARDAALRGLSVALVERGDFGQAASANSLKTIHGGLRYLQDADLGLMRLMIRERTAWLRAAPHLVQPLPCLMPTYPAFKRSKTAMTVALKLNDWLSYDRNQGLAPDRRLPAGQIISPTACRERLPGLPDGQLTGGAIWHDAQMYNSERVLLAVILSAAAAGATVANYVEAVTLLQQDDGVRGIVAKDTLTGQSFEIAAKLTANCAGGWTDQVLRQANGQALPVRYPLSIAINLVTRNFIPTYAAGIPSCYLSRDKNGKEIMRERLLFVAPWRDYSLVGTLHLPYHGQPQDFELSETTIRAFVDELNTAYPGAELAYDEVCHVHWGFLPTKTKAQDKVKLVRRGRVIDHAREDGLAGLITVVGVKYTTARAVAETATDLALKKLGRPAVACQTAHRPLWGGDIEQFDTFLAQAIAKHQHRLSATVIDHLARSYGSEYELILSYLDENAAWGQPVTAHSPVLQAEIIHAVRGELAQTLNDVIQRRTELGAAGLPDEESLRVCAGLMAAELSWDQGRQAQEIEAVRASYTITQQLRIKNQETRMKN